jgi:hypothetical protein
MDWHYYKDFNANPQYHEVGWQSILWSCLGVVGQMACYAYLTDIAVMDYGSHEFRVGRGTGTGT